ncbi:MAG: hypothetical protein KJ624_01370 [Chloroflexi bacterium]|nr:hypothetical protein [Chloroflexota bacterium]
MKGWNGFLLLAIALGLLMTTSCSRGVPQTEYDKARADLATAQAQATDLGAQLVSAKASLDKANADLAQTKADSDKAKADLATAQARVQSLQNDYTSAIAERDKARNDLVQVRADSDKAKADLAAAQARAQKLEGDVSLGLAQARDLQSELGSAKASLDKARADLAQTTADYTLARADLQAALARVQSLESQLALAQGGQGLPGSLATLQAYAKVTDLLFMDPYRQQLGLLSNYQYTEAQLRAEADKAVGASNDPVLKALWIMGMSEGPLESFGIIALVYHAIALNGILSGEGTPAVFPPAPMAVSASPAGQTLLQVKLVATDGKPVPNMGMALWRDVSPLDPPDAGVAKTNASGIASFTVKEGVYWIDFSPDNPLTPLMLSSGRMVLVKPGMVTQVEIPVFSY